MKWHSVISRCQYTPAYFRKRNILITCTMLTIKLLIIISRALKSELKMNTLNKGVELWCKAEEGYGFYYTQDKVNVLV